MSKQKHNRYEKKAAKNSIVEHLANGLPTKHNVKNTLLETGKDLVIGVLGGGLVGAAIGKPSLLVGLGVAGIGHFTEHHLATLFGIGIMAANGFQKQTVSGLEGIDGVKERLEAYKENFAEKLYIKHIITKKLDSGVHGMGELQFFNYANDIDELNEMRGELSNELKALDSIEKQIEQSGIDHAHNTGINIDEQVGQGHDEDEDDENTGHQRSYSQTETGVNAKTKEEAAFDLDETNI
jgi:hypothetical protein